MAFFSSSPTRDAANAASTTRSSPLRAASSNAFTRTARPRPVTGRERSRSRSRPAFTHTSISGFGAPRAKPASPRRRRGDGDVQRRVPLPVPRAEHACGVEIKHARQHSPVIRARRDVRGGARVTPRGYFDGVLLAVLAVAADDEIATGLGFGRARKPTVSRRATGGAARTPPPPGSARARARQSRAGRSRVRARRPSTRAKTAGDSNAFLFCLGRPSAAPPSAAAFSRRTPPPRHRTPTARRRRRRSPHTRAPARRRPPTLAPRPSSRRGPRPPAWRTTRTDVVATARRRPGIFRASTPESAGRRWD